MQTLEQYKIQIEVNTNGVKTFVLSPLELVLPKYVS